jgi:formate/nitrite transporter FocA (FNT family)
MIYEDTMMRVVILVVINGSEERLTTSSKSIVSSASFLFTITMKQLMLLLLLLLFRKLAGLTLVAPRVTLFALVARCIPSGMLPQPDQAEFHGRRYRSMARE